LKQVLSEQVRKTATKVAAELPSTLSAGDKGVLASPALRAPNFRDLKERGMGAVIHIAEKDKPYFLELDVCLWYHRDEIAVGALSQTVIVAAREGALESSGCADWKAPRWWEELRSFDARVRATLKLNPARPDDTGKN
jgi:hypothetical protein